MKLETVSVIVTIMSGILGSTAFIVSRFTKVETKLDDHIQADEKTHTRFDKTLDDHSRQITDLLAARRGRG